jgi:ribosomal protein L44E
VKSLQFSLFQGFRPALPNAKIKTQHSVEDVKARQRNSFDWGLGAIRAEADASFKPLRTNHGNSQQQI